MYISVITIMTSYIYRKLKMQSLNTKGLSKYSLSKLYN